MKKITFIVLSFLMGIAVWAQEGKPKTITLTDAERTLVKQNSDFAFNLFRQIRDTENHVISPLSITYALSMLNNGAEGVTRDEICQVLSGNNAIDDGQWSKNYVATMNAFCRKMLTESTLLDEDTRVAIANTIYFNGDRKNIALKSAFKEAAATYYDATPTVLSFSDEASLGIINQWASDQTDGMIHDLLKPEDMQNPNLVSFLLNAICFKGAWVNQFDEQYTQNAYFGEDGKHTAMMMMQVNEFRCAMTDLYRSIILPYGNGSYQMTVFLPKYGKTIDDLLDAMNGSNWNTAEYKSYEVYLGMPRIETDTNQNLEEVMASLGMKNAFLKYDGHGFMDFCHFGDNEADSDPCWISMMRQKAHLKLDEKGTEAAAATIIGMEDKSMPEFLEFFADRPFLYVISERSTGSIFFIGQYMGEPIKNLRHDISLTEEEKQLVASNNDFALRLFNRARGKENSIMSPLSITYALGMMNNGAAGKTQQEICDVLGFGTAGADGINQFCRKMLNEAPTLDEETTAEIANTIYVNSGRGYELQQGFVDKANEFYDAQPEARDFNDGQTRDVINQWGNSHTHGMIPMVFPTEASFNKDAASYLLNALYFKGTWANKFDKEKTKDEPFNSGETVPMMSQTEEYDYTETDLYQAVRLPYGNGAYQMTLFLPREGKTIADVLASMDGHNWQFDSYGDCHVDLKMPRFKIETSLNLVQIMADLGMPTAFTPAAEFPYFGNRTVFIGDMFQKAVIDLDEDGTKAAAITVIEVTDSMPLEVTFHANRPFFYIISERSTGVIFFIGQYMGEGAKSVNSIKDEAWTMDNEQWNRKQRPLLFDLSGRRLSAPPAKGLYIEDKKVKISK